MYLNQEFSRQSTPPREEGNDLRHRIFVGYVALMVLVFLAPVPSTPLADSTHVDKLVHFGVFLGDSLCSCTWIEHRRYGGRSSSPSRSRRPSSWCSQPCPTARVMHGISWPVPLEPPWASFSCSGSSAVAAALPRADRLQGLRKPGKAHRGTRHVIDRDSRSRHQAEHRKGHGQPVIAGAAHFPAGNAVAFLHHQIVAHYPGLGTNRSNIFRVSPSRSLSLTGARPPAGRWWCRKLETPAPRGGESHRSTRDLSSATSVPRSNAGRTTRSPTGSPKRSPWFSS